MSDFLSTQFDLQNTIHQYNLKVKEYIASYLFLRFWIAIETTFELLYYWVYMDYRMWAHTCSL